MVPAPELIAKDFLDQLLVSKGHDPREFYRLIQRLEQDPELREVLPQLDYADFDLDLEVTARYRGSTPLDPAGFPEKFFSNLALRTGIEFQNPHHRQTDYGHIFGADVLMGEDEKVFYLAVHS